MRRTPTPYTPASVADLRDRADKGQSDTSLAHYFAWSVDQVRSVARKHGIEVRQGEVSSVADSRRREVAAAGVSIGYHIALPTASPPRRERRDPTREAFSIMFGAQVAPSMADRIDAFAKARALSRSQAMRALLAAGLDAFASPVSRR